MADIQHDFFVGAKPAKVFDIIATPEGLDAWWTETCSGKPATGEQYDLGFGPEYQWKATVGACVPGKEFEFRMMKSDDDWKNSVIKFQLSEAGNGCQVRFSHTGWPLANEHYRISSYCWAMYLRLLKLHVEKGLVVPYKDRLDV